MARNVPSGLRAELFKLYSTPIQLFELYTDPNQNNPTHYFAANNEDVVFGGTTYTALAIKRAPLKSEEGTILNDIEIGLDNVDLAFKQLVASGALSNRRMVVKLVFANHLSSADDFILLIDGPLDEPKGDDHWVTMTMKPFPVFEREYPLRIYQVNCNWVFGDANCTVNKDDFASTGTIESGSTAQVINMGTGHDNDYFVPGYFVITEPGHPLYGESRPIKASDGGTITLRVALDDPPPSGIACKVQKLCAKTQGACTNIFSNWANFGGFPYVPFQPYL
jgi:hypothetical protein